MNCSSCGVTGSVSRPQIVSTATCEPGMPSGNVHDRILSQSNAVLNRTPYDTVSHRSLGRSPARTSILLNLLADVLLPTHRRLFYDLFRQQPSILTMRSFGVLGREEVCRSVEL